MTKHLRILAAAAVLAPCWLSAQSHGWTPTMPAQSWPQPDTLEGQAGPVYGKPFTATEVRRTTQTLADGTKVDRSDSTTFTRDDRGRMRTAGDKNVIIFDPVAGYHYTLDVLHKTYQKARVPQRLNTISIAVSGGHTSVWSSSGDSDPQHLAANSWFHNLRGNTGTTEELPAQTINGVHAKGSRVTITIPAGSFGNDREVKVVNERWYSDDLQVLVKSTNSDPRFGVTTYELTNIVTAAPDPALFLVPSDYRER